MSRRERHFFVGDASDFQIKGHATGNIAGNKIKALSKIIQSTVYYLYEVGIKKGKREQTKIKVRDTCYINLAGCVA